MSRSDAAWPKQASYPPPPWKLSGRQWAGLYRIDSAPAMGSLAPLGWKPIFPKHLGVALLQYAEGTLTYQELLVAIPVRSGLRVSLWVRDLWVNDQHALLGGVHIWNLPKQMAAFQWDDDQVTVADDQGVVAKLVVKQPRTLLPWAIGRLPMVGTMDGTPSFASCRWTGRVSIQAPRIIQWSSRFPERPSSHSSVGFSSQHFTVTVRAGKQFKSARPESP